VTCIERPLAIIWDVVEHRLGDLHVVATLLLASDPDDQS
jgi:hypothetical protein